jgi:hypothetical protein
LYLRLVDSERRALKAMESHLVTPSREPSMVMVMQGHSRRVNGETP